MSRAFGRGSFGDSVSLDDGGGGVSVYKDSRQKEKRGGN